jgi:N-acetylmuramic acid 6-phosphate etherase
MVILLEKMDCSCHDITMTTQPSTPSTEDVPEASAWLDQLDTREALGIMLKSQRQAADAVENAMDAMTKVAEVVAKRLGESQTGRLIYAGAGTSARIGVQDGVELPPTFGWPPERLAYLIAGGREALMRSVEGAEDNAQSAKTDVDALNITSADIVIGLAASGRTTYTIAALDVARQGGALTIGIANNRDTPLLAVAEYPILIETGGEALAGSTRLKAGTAQKMTLNLISTFVMARLGRVSNGLMVAMSPSNAKLRERKLRIDAMLADQAPKAKTK